MQTFFVTQIYLLYGAAFLLADGYGVRFPLLLSLRYHFRINGSVRLLLIIAGFVISLLLAFFPVDPGPPLFGDLIPSLNVLSLAFYYLYLSLRGEQEGGEGDGSVLHATATYVEHNRRGVGIATVVIACLHFVIPHYVLI